VLAPSLQHRQGAASARFPISNHSLLSLPLPGALWLDLLQGGLAQGECLRITTPRSPMSVRRNLSCVFMSKEAKFAMASRLWLSAAQSYGAKRSG